MSAEQAVQECGCKNPMLFDVDGVVWCAYCGDRLSDLSVQRGEYGPSGDRYVKKEK